MADTVIKTTYQLRRGLSTTWTERNPILAYGEPGFEKDTYRLKIGDGVAPWNDLPYLGGGEYSVSVDGKSISLSSNIIAMYGFSTAKIGQIPSKGIDGKLVWIDQDSTTSVLVGFYLNGKFYTDSTYIEELEKNPKKIYIDRNSNVLYNYNGESFISTNQTLPMASDSDFGIAKLYQAFGQNTDGSMSQKMITDSFKAINLAIDEQDEECLVLELPQN